MTRAITRKSVLAALLLNLLLVSTATNADVNSFLAGMVYSGTTPFDSNDANATNNDVRTHDDAAYRAAFSLTPSDTGAVIKYEMGNFTIPPTLLSGVTPPSRVAFFDPLKLPTGGSGCQNISQNPVANPAPVGTSGVTGDGQTVFCSLPSPIGGVTLDIPLTVMGNAPNGTLLDAPTITFESDNNAATNTPTVANNGSTTFGMDQLTLTSSPQWDLTKDSLRGGLFIPKSGPAGEDGFVLGFNIGIHGTGSRKGLEALNTAYFTENYSDPKFPNAQLVNWNIDSPGYGKVLNTDPNACAGWQTKQQAVGNYFDNGFHFPRDKNNGSNKVYDISYGGTCVAQTINNTLKTATIDLLGVDWSLSQYPTNKGTNPAGTKLINTANLDDPTNEWWVGSKSLLIWIPTTDVPADGVGRLLNNKAYLFGTSITGQSNVEPVLTSADNTENSGVINTVAGTLSVRYVPLKSNNPLGLDLAPRDPNVTSSAHVNQASPEQVMDTQLATYNTGTTTYGAGMFCNKMDNSRLSYLNRTPIVAGYRALRGDSVLDPDTGVITRPVAGNISDIANLDFQLGVGGVGASNGGWDSFSGVTSEYLFPSGTGSTNAESGCEDGDATWFDSIVALEAAGHTLQEVNRVRATYDSFTAGAKYLHYVPLQIRDTFAYSGTDTAAGAFAANDSTLDKYTTNVVLWERGSGLADAKTGDAALIFNNEFMQVSKSSPTHPNGALASPGAQISYELQVNATTTGAAHNTDITVWDVLPDKLSYNLGSSMLGGVAIADPVCTTSGLPIDIFPSGTVPVGHSACQWLLPNQLATKATPGSSAGNLPVLSFAATVSVSAVTNDQLLNTSFADSTDNAKQKAFYGGEGKGFGCKPRQNCSFSNWLLKVSANPGIVLNKSVDQPLVTADASFSYKLNYGVIGNSLPNVRLLEILPYSGDLRGSNFSGTLALSGPAALDASDATARLLYTKNASANIKADPYDTGHDLSNGGTNTATTSNWCTAGQFASVNCPANFAEATGMMILPFAGTPQSCGNYGNVPCLVPGSLYDVSFSVVASGNKHTDTYFNSFVGDSPGLLARAPGSNVVSTEVIVPDLVITKAVSPGVVDAGETATYVITPKNNTGDGVGPVANTAGTVITITDNLPSGVRIISAANVDGGANWDCSASAAPSTVSCLYDNSGLPIGVGGAIGNPISIDVIAATLEATTEIDNTASIQMSGQTEISNNNTDTANLTVRARPSSPDIPFGECKVPDLSNIEPDGIPDYTFPRGYWATSYFEGANQIAGSTAMSGDVNGSGASGIPLFRGEAFWGAGENPVVSASNGSHNAVGTWRSTETPTSSSLPHPSYVGSTWGTTGSPFYQVDFRRKIDISGTITIGGLANSYVDDSIEIFVNDTRVYGAFPGGGVDPYPNATNKGEVSVSADDEVLIRFINLGFIGGYDLSFDTTGVDCSDAPASYGSAMHVVPDSPTVFIGEIAADTDDATEHAANGSADATGDDASGTDDEDAYSVLPSVWTTTSQYRLVVGCSLPGAKVSAWIDFNQNGQFDAGERNDGDAKNCPSSKKVNLNWTGLSDVVAGDSYARIRIASEESDVASPVGLSDDGEVEDHPITFQDPGVGPEVCVGKISWMSLAGQRAQPVTPWNVSWPERYINADISFRTTMSGTNRKWVPNARNATATAFADRFGSAGSVVNLNYSNDLTGDGSTVVDFVFDRPLPTNTYLVVRDIDATTETLTFSNNSLGTLPAPSLWESNDPLLGSANSPSIFSGWDAPTQQLITISNGPNNDQEAYVWDATGMTTVRATYTTYAGSANIGFVSCIPQDFGDAPDSYGTTQSANGARHGVINDVYLGAAKPDAEVDGVAVATADSDDTGSDDEDGVATVPSLSSLDSSYRITVNATNATASAGRLVAWVDFDGSGTFDADEAAARVVPAGTSATNVDIVWSNIPADIQQGATYLRLRFTTDAMNASDAQGEKIDGEVEDYTLTIVSSGASVSGRVYIDANSNASEDAGESGIGGTVVVLYDSLSNSCRSVKTNGNGDYRFTGIADGGYQLYQAHRETTPLPQSCGTASAKNPVGYQSTTLDNLSVMVLGADVIDQDFGEVAGANSAVTGNTGAGIRFDPNHQSEVLPGNVVFYAHTFSSEADGAVRFTTTDGGNSTTGWTHSLYRDLNCNGVLDGAEGNTPVSGINFGVSAGGKQCIIDKVYAPANAPLRDQYRVETTATFTFQGGAPTPVALKVSDITTTGQKATPTTPADPERGESRLELRKTIENLTQLTAETATLNQAKPGDLLKYRIYYQNSGTGPITDLNVKDTIPTYTGFVGTTNACDTTPVGMTCTPNFNIDELNWEFTGELVGGASGNVSYEVMIDN